MRSVRAWRRASSDLESILAQSHGKRPNKRVAAIKGLRRFIAADPVSFSRLRQMLADPISEVAYEAAESLVEDRGFAGLEAVLDELGRRVDDPTSDAIVHSLEVLETTRRVRVLARADVLEIRGPADSVRAGIHRIRIRLGEQDSEGTDLESLLVQRHSDDLRTREGAAIVLGAYLPNLVALQGLSELLGDNDTAIEVEAAESLVRFGGIEGLMAVLGELGRRIDDPDADDIASHLQSLQGAHKLPILQNARLILANDPPPDVRVGIAEIEQLFGGYA